VSIQRGFMRSRKNMWTSPRIVDTQFRV